MPDDEKTKLLWWAIGLLLTSVGINTGIQKNFINVRDDPYSGAEGEALTIRVDNAERLLLKQEERLDKIEVFNASIGPGMRNYVNAEFKKESEECAKYRQDIERRLARFEFLQEQVVSTLRHYGIELDIRGKK